MKTLSIFTALAWIPAFALLLAGCAHPDGRPQAQAAQSAIARSDAATVAADAANAQAQTQVQAIDDKVVRLLNSR